MSKYGILRSTSKESQEELFINLAKAILCARNVVDAAHILKDLFTEAETIMIAKRLMVAELLQNGYTYKEIKKVLKVSDPTIAKIQSWLHAFGQGFELITKRKTKTTNLTKYSQWRSFKKKHAMYFWPELLLQEIVRNANKREKDRLRSIINQIKIKNDLHVNLENLLSDKT